MAEPHVITALVAKYRELSGRLKACETETERLKSALSHVDATIRIYREDFDTAAILPKRPYRRNPHFKKGIMVRSAMDVLRTAQEPMTAREIAKRTLECQGISEPESDTIEALRRALNGSLMKRLRDGDVVADGSYPKWWRVVG